MKKQLNKKVHLGINNSVKKNKKINKYKYLNRKIDISLIIEKRYKILICFIVFLMLLLSFKIFYMQIICAKSYSKSLDELTQNVIEGESTPRGRIYDRNGKIIVDNKSVKTIYYKKPKGVTSDEEVKTAYKVASYIEVDYSKLTDNMLREFFVKCHPKKSKAKITDNEWRKLKERKILIRHFSSEKISQYNRVTIGTEDEMKTFINAVEEILKEVRGLPTLCHTRTPHSAGRDTVENDLLQKNPLNHYNKIRLEDKGITCRTAAPHTVSHTILASGIKEKNRRQGNCARNDER